MNLDEHFKAIEGHLEAILEIRQGEPNIGIARAEVDVKLEEMRIATGMCLNTEGDDHG